MTSMTTARRQRPVAEGTWFAVPLLKTGFAVGVVARAAPKGGVVLAYFFPQVWAEPPPLGKVAHLRSDAAVRVLRVGDLGFIERSWSVIGCGPDWRRDEWPIPVFVRKDELSRRAWCVRYDDGDLGRVVSEESTSYESDLERDGLHGARAAEVVLTKQLT